MKARGPRLCARASLLTFFEPNLDCMPALNDATAGPRAASSLLGCVVLGAVLSVVLLGSLGCEDRLQGRDSGPLEDTNLTEGGIIREDTGPRLDAAGSDAAPPDAAVDLCATACDPRGEAMMGCVDDLRCILNTEAPMCGAGFGLLAEGTPCEAPDACAPGLACFRAGRTSGGVCGRVCCSTENSCGASARCGGDGVLVDGTATAWGRCVLPRTCDVLMPELTCETREGCYVIDGAGATECRLAGAALAGELCAVAEDCAAGLFCGGLGERTCLRICSIAMPRCAATERCIAQTYSPEGTGICVESMAIRP